MYILVHMYVCKYNMYMYIYIEYIYSIHLLLLSLLLLCVYIYIPSGPQVSAMGGVGHVNVMFMLR